MNAELPRVLADLTPWACRHRGTMCQIPFAGHESVLSSSLKTPRDSLVLTGIGLAGFRITLSVELKPEPNCTTLLTVEHEGDLVLCHVPPDFRRPGCLRAETATLEPVGDGYQRLSVTWRNSRQTLSIAASPLRGSESPDGDVPQWCVRNLTIAVQDPLPVIPDAQLVYVDIGARGGVAPHIARLGNLIRPVLVDADEKEATAVAARERKWFSEVTVIPFGLANSDGDRTLYVTRASTCSSLLRPNPKVLDRYPRKKIFSVIKELKIQCRRYDGIYYEKMAPRPEYIKIDVQGFEFEVLEGFGGLLDTVLGIELECHAYQIYENQKMVGDIITMLDRRGFSLRSLQPQNAQKVFGGEICEFNAWFLRRDDALPAAVPFLAEKMELCRSLMPRS